MKHLHTFETFLNEGLNDTSFNKETVEKIWDVIKAACGTDAESVSLSLNKLYNSKSEKWEFVSKNADKLKIGQITATTSSLLVMIVENATVKGYFEISPFDVLKQKFKPGTVYVSVVTNDDLSNPRIRKHQKIVYHS